jgi:hypothetical protein
MIRPVSVCAAVDAIRTVPHHAPRASRREILAALIMGAGSSECEAFAVQAMEWAKKAHSLHKKNAPDKPAHSFGKSE